MTTKNTAPADLFATEDETPEQGFVLDFTQGGEGFTLIPDNTVVNVSVEEARGREYNDQVQFAVKLRIEDGEYRNRIIFENVNVLNADENFKMKRLLDACDYEGDRAIKLPAGWANDDLIAALDFIGQEIEGRMITAIVNQWGGGRTNPATGEPYPKRNGVKKLMPYQTVNTADDLL